ncbi:hypothetical protein [Dactylosporangium sp. NPDC051484]
MRRIARNTTDPRHGDLGAIEVRAARQVSAVMGRRPAGGLARTSQEAQW